MQQEDLWGMKSTEQPEKKKPTAAFNSMKLPTEHQVEKLRLILSTYQDGTGQNDGGSAPDWRDFERAVAATFEGYAQESKHVFDVVVPTHAESRAYGISCKMRGELKNTVDRTIKRQNRTTFKKGRVSMELSNSAKYFWNVLKAKGIDETNYKEKPVESGIALVELVRSWHDAISMENGGVIDLDKSYYLVLQWEKNGTYQLFQFPVHLPEPSTLNWYFPSKTVKNGEEVDSVRLVGADKYGPVFEWYGDTGGQLKYYPLTDDAIWKSEPFRLELLPTSDSLEYGIIAKAKTYFPAQWESASKLGELSRENNMA